MRFLPKRNVKLEAYFTQRLTVFDLPLHAGRPVV